MSDDIVMSKCDVVVSFLVFWVYCLICIGLVVGGFGVYWLQFLQLLFQLQELIVYVVDCFQQMDVEVIDVGFVFDVQEVVFVVEKLCQVDCDFIVMFIMIYLMLLMVLLIVQCVNMLVLVIDLQLIIKMDYVLFGIGEWFVYCGQCLIFEIGNVFWCVNIFFCLVLGWLW